MYLLNIREIWMKRSFKLFSVIIFHSRLLNNPSNNAALEFRERWQHATVCCFNDQHPVNYSNLLGKASHYRSLYTLLDVNLPQRSNYHRRFRETFAKFNRKFVTRNTVYTRFLVFYAKIITFQFSDKRIFLIEIFIIISCLEFVWKLKLDKRFKLSGKRNGKFLLILLN